MSVVLNNQQLEALPVLPEVKFLWCARNLLTEIPVLPKLKLLNIGYNRLTSLTVPETLTNLNCDENQITELVLPESLTSLSCLGNPIRVLNLPPNLTSLCAENPVTITNIPNCLKKIIIHSLARLDDDSWLRLIDHMPNTYYEMIMTEIMLRDVSSIVVLKRMLLSPYFKQRKVLERLIVRLTVKKNLQTLTNATAVWHILSF